MNKELQFLIYNTSTEDIKIDVPVRDETIWLTQKCMARVFDISIPTINEHLKSIFDSEELQKNSVIRNFRITASDGKTYDTQHYNLDAIISVDYWANSAKATQFRIWATKALEKNTGNP